MSQPTEFRQELLARSVVSGFATGLRSQAALAAIVRRPPADSDNPGLLHSKLAYRLTAFAVIGEIVGDKMPFTPNRVDPAPLVVRIALGALCGGLLAREIEGSVAIGSVTGATAAFAGSYAGFWLRRTAVAATGWPDSIIALAEDTIALATGAAAAR
jgi:uncharacterized membrane protein